MGCAAAFDERNRRVARAFVTCLEAAGVRYAVLGQEESCTGDPARRMGNDYVYQMLATGNIATLDRYRPTTIVTACPHCFNALGVEYRQLGGVVRRWSITRRSWHAWWRRGGSALPTPGRVTPTGSSPTTTPATWPATTA